MQKLDENYNIIEPTVHPRNEYNLNELFFGQVLEGVYALDKFAKAEAQNGSIYAKVMISDSYGKINGNIFDFDRVNADGHLNNIHEGDFVKLRAKITEYRDKLQLSEIDMVKLDMPGLDELSQPLMLQLAGQPPFSYNAFVTRLSQFLDMMEDGKIKNIVKYIYDDWCEDMWHSPAAVSMHHDMTGGLALHTVTMAESAVALYKIYRPLYPNLNLTLLLGGVLLHDVGKVMELSGPVATHYTGIGVLEGHITLAVHEVNIAALDLGYKADLDEEVQLLTHMILAHHLKGEWGSPVSPAFIEAQLLHNIDKIDADVQEYKKTELELEVGQSGNGRWHGIEGRVYRPSIHPEWTDAVKMQQSGPIDILHDDPYYNIIKPGLTVQQ